MGDERGPLAPGCAEAAAALLWAGPTGPRPARPAGFELTRQRSEQGGGKPSGGLSQGQAPSRAGGRWQAQQTILLRERKRYDNGSPRGTKPVLCSTALSAFGPRTLDCAMRLSAKALRDAGAHIADA